LVEIGGRAENGEDDAHIHRAPNRAPTTQVGHLEICRLDVSTLDISTPEISTLDISTLDISTLDIFRVASESDGLESMIISELFYPKPLLRGRRKQAPLGRQPPLAHETAALHTAALTHTAVGSCRLGRGEVATAQEEADDHEKLHARSRHHLSQDHRPI
jgi:hypothetical protein